MEESRVVIETSKYQKEALELVLRERGMTMTEWFNEKISEANPQIDTKNENYYEIEDLKELEDSSETLKRIQNIDWAFTESNTTYLSHNIHPYPAKFIPQIPRFLIGMLSVKGETVWDPFGGSGTTALEALLLDRQAISSDINPIASLIGKAKTLTLSKEEDDAIIDLIEKLRILSENEFRITNIIDKNINEYKDSIPEIPNIAKWFHQNAVNELGYIKWQIEKFESTNCKVLLNAAFSKIILKASFQDGETRYSSKYRDIGHGEILRMYIAELTSSLNKVRLISPLIRFKDATFISSDLRTNFVVEPNSIDLIVTSPPYANATDYFLYHRFRLFWLGYDPRSLSKCEIGAHLRHQKEHTGFDEYIQEMTLCLGNMYRGLRAGRYAVLVLGNAIFDGNQFDTAQLLSIKAQEIGFEFVGIVKRKVHATKRSFITAARRLEEESIMILRKPPIKMIFKLIPPNYKLWRYEDEIRIKEVHSLLPGIPLNNEGADILVDISPYDIEAIRKLTFTHNFESEKYYRSSTWQSILENGDALSQANRKDPKYVTHGIHPYKGKFYPQLAKSLFNLAELKIGQNILDPFCGSGTVLLEGYLNGFSAKGLDINPLAIKIARAKTEILSIDPYLTDRLLKYIIDKLGKIVPVSEYAGYFNEGILSELESWFPIDVLQKIGGIISLLDETPEPTVKEFVEVCFSSIIRDISQQDPLDLRIRRRKIPLEDAPVFELLQKRLADQRLRLLKFSRIANKAPFQFGSTQVSYGDCRDPLSFEKAGITPYSINAIVTSPPYATALPYIDTDRLSILLLFNLQSKVRSQIEMSLIGSREISKKEKNELEKRIIEHSFTEIRSQTAKRIIQDIYSQNIEHKAGFRKENMASLIFRYYKDMNSVLQNLDSVIAPNGSIFFVIGENKTEAGNKTISITSSVVLQEIGTALGWKIQEILPITVTQENRLHNKNGITKNDIIWFKKID